MYNINKYDIVFFNSPIYRVSTDDGEDYLPPLGQGYIVSNLLRQGIRACIIDCVQDRLGIEEISDLINNSKVLNVAFNVFSINMDLLNSIVEKVKRKVNFYIGGKAVEYIWREMSTWNWGEKRVVYMIGECDWIYYDILQGKSKEAPIYSCNNQKAYLVTPKSVYYPNDLNKCILDRSLFKNRYIQNHYGRFEGCIITSRGCWYNCAFCGGSRYANPELTVRTSSEASIIREINNLLVIDPEINSIRILDDLFLKDRKSILKAVAIFKKFPNIHWRCMAHINTFKNTKDLLIPLKQCGCDEIFIGIESGSQVIRERIHKLGSVEEILSICEEILSAGIDIKGYFICGFPHETKNQMDETVYLAHRLKQMSYNKRGKFRATAFQFRPYHGTEIYDKLIKEEIKMGDFEIGNNTSSKKQYSFVAGNFSEVEDEYIKKCINNIVE